MPTPCNECQHELHKDNIRLQPHPCSQNQSGGDIPFWQTQDNSGKRHYLHDCMSHIRKGGQLNQHNISCLEYNKTQAIGQQMFLTNTFQNTFKIFFRKIFLFWTELF